MVHFHLCFFQVGNIMEHAVQQRASPVFTNPFYLNTHPYDMPVPVLLAELKIIHAFLPDYLHGPGYYHGSILTVGHIRCISFDQLPVLLHCIS